jgi:hypothetical protein
MNSIILLPLLLSKVLSFAIDHPNNTLLQAQHQRNNQNNFFKLCVAVKYTANNLQEVSIPKTTMQTNLIDFLEIMGYNKTEETDIQAFISTPPSTTCAVEIYKNQTSNLFVFDYKIMPLARCNNNQQSQIICDTGNCTNAIKCCDSTAPFCINTFALKKIMPNRAQDNNNIDSCVANNTNCFSIVQLYNFTKAGDRMANSQQRLNISFLQLIYLSIASLLAGL